MAPRRSGRTPKPTAKYAAYKSGLITTAKKTSKTTKAVKATPILKTAIQKVIRRNLETKFKIDAPYNYNSGSTLEDWTQFSTAITGTGEIYSLVPKMTQGDDDWQRVGQAIQPTRLTVKVNIALGALASSSVYVDVWFMSSKGIKDPKLTANIDVNNLLNDGQGTNVPYDGTSYTAMLPVNTSQFTVIKHKRIYLAKPYGDPQGLYSGAGAPPASNYSLARNTKQFSVRIPLPKRLTYLEKADYTASNTFPFMMVGFYAADQFGGTALTPTLPIYVQAQSHLSYKDA